MGYAGTYGFTITASDEAAGFHLHPAGKTHTDSVAVNVTVVPEASTNNAPVVSTSPGATAYTENGLPVRIDNALTLSDSDSTMLTGATVTISGGFQAGDTLSVLGPPGGGPGGTGNQGSIITSSYDSATGVLTLTGSASVESYQNALRAVTFSSTDDNPLANKTITVVATGGVNPSTAATKTIIDPPPNLDL